MTLISRIFTDLYEFFQNANAFYNFYFIRFKFKILSYLSFIRSISKIRSYVFSVVFSVFGGLFSTTENTESHRVFSLTNDLKMTFKWQIIFISVNPCLNFFDTDFTDFHEFTRTFSKRKKFFFIIINKIYNSFDRNLSKNILHGNK